MSNCFTSSQLSPQSLLRSTRIRIARGAAALEMALVVMLFLSIVLATVYLGLYSVTKSIVDAGLGNALDLAATHPGLNDDFPTNCTANDYASTCCQRGSNSDTKWCKALEDIAEEALKLPDSTVLKRGPGAFAYIDSPATAVSVNVPVVLDNQDPAVVYRDEPIEIVITYNALNIYGGYKTLTRSGYILYETPAAGAFNVDVDCNGYSRGSPQFNKTNCICDAAAGEAPGVVAGVRQCVLCASLNPLARNTNTGTFVNQNGATQPTNHSSAVYNWGTHRSTRCYCPSHQMCQDIYGSDARVQGNTCRCYCSKYNTQNGTFNAECACGGSVPGSYPTSGYNTAFPPVTFEPERTNINGGYCGCKIAPGQYGGATQITTQMCKDWFPSFAGSRGWRAHPNGCKCYCAWSSSLGNGCSGSQRDYSSCTCKCPANRVQNPTTGRCECSSDPAVNGCASNETPDASKNCRCKPSCDQDPHSHYNPSSNSCKCNCGTPAQANLYPNCIDCGSSGGNG